VQRQVPGQDAPCVRVPSEILEKMDENLAGGVAHAGQVAPQRSPLHRRSLVAVVHSRRWHVAPTEPIATAAATSLCCGAPPLTWPTNPLGVGAELAIPQLSHRRLERPLVAKRPAAIFRGPRRSHARCDSATERPLPPPSRSQQSTAGTLIWLSIPRQDRPPDQCGAVPSSPMRSPHPFSTVAANVSTVLDTACPRRVRAGARIRRQRPRFDRS
jgi:hypothetical protein